MNKPNSQRNVTTLAAMAGALLALGFTLNILSKLSAQNSAPAIAPLQPVHLFRLPVAQEVHVVVQDFVVNEGGLYFLINEPGASELIHTDLDGHPINRFLVPVTNQQSRSSAVRVDNDGNIVVLYFASQRSQALLFMASSGNLIKRLPLNRIISPSTLTTIGSKLFALESGARTIISEPDETAILSITPPGPGSYLSLSFQQQIIGIIDRPTGHLLIADIDGHSTKDITLTAPEIQNVMRTATASSVPVTVSSAAIGSGSFFCSIAPYRRKEGAIILQFDLNGQLRRRFRFSLPTADSLKTDANPTGYMQPWSIGVGGGRLFLVDRAHAMYTYCNIPAN